jgi:AbrB family looped-hinge helix DNA binding protein
MAFALSKVTAQGQISVAAEVRRKLGLGPGSVLEWNEEGDKIVVRKAGRYSSEEIHRKLFPTRSPRPRKLEELKEAVLRRAREKHARRDTNVLVRLITRDHDEQAELSLQGA